MDYVIITGSSGLIGSEAVHFFCKKNFHVIGIDNDMRSYFFGDNASTKRNLQILQQTYKNFEHINTDIRNKKALDEIFLRFTSKIKLIIHTAAQPSHDWAAREPVTDFEVNAGGTLLLLEAARTHCPEAVFIFTSTNKVYGDTPNSLPLVEKETRWEVNEQHMYYQNGIDETMSIDQSKHSLFGVSKSAADLLVQEYGRYFNMKTAVFRGGCLTGPRHCGTELHGFLSYLTKCAVTGNEYTIFGYKGKQVRDNIHSADLVNAFYHVYQKPRCAEVYNIGGGRFSNCSVIEAARICEEITGIKLKTRYSDTSRSGDHIWWISDCRKFCNHYPEWSITHNVTDIIKEIYLYNKNIWA